MKLLVPNNSRRQISNLDGAELSRLVMRHLPGLSRYKRIWNKTHASQNHRTNAKTFWNCETCAGNISVRWRKRFHKMWKWSI